MQRLELENVSWKKKRKAERHFKQKRCVWKEFSCVVKRIIQSWVQIDAYKMINDVPSLTLGFLNQVKRRWYYLLLGSSFILIKMWHSFLASVSPDEKGSSGFSLQDCRTLCIARSWRTVKDYSVEGDFSVSPVAGNAPSSNTSSSTGGSSFLSFFL